MVFHQQFPNTNVNRTDCSWFKVWFSVMGIQPSRAFEWSHLAMAFESSIPYSHGTLTYRATFMHAAWIHTHTLTCSSYVQWHSKAFQVAEFKFSTLTTTTTKKHGVVSPYQELDTSLWPLFLKGNNHRKWDEIICLMLQNVLVCSQGLKALRKNWARISSSYRKTKRMTGLKSHTLGQG